MWSYPFLFAQFPHHGRVAVEHDDHRNVASQSGIDVTIKDTGKAAWPVYFKQDTKKNVNV